MTMLGAKYHQDGLAFAKDYIGVDYHNDSHSHLEPSVTWRMKVALQRAAGRFGLRHRGGGGDVRC